MSNPWNEIPLSDYEAHMGSASIMQMQAINGMMKVQLESFPVTEAMILGIAGGNGIEHIDDKKYRKIYGVDVNEKYLMKAEKRYGDCDGILKYLHKDLLTEYAKLPCSELVIANLIIEYIGYNVFKKVIMQVKPIYVSCAIQVNGESKEFISNSVYASVFNGLEKIHHEIDEKHLMKTMQEIKYQPKDKAEWVLPNGKKLLKVDFIKNPVIEIKE